METRTTRSKVTFPCAFALPGSKNRFPAGDYEVVIEEERLQGLTFDAYRRTAAWLVLAGTPQFPGRSEMHPVTEADLQSALGCDRTSTGTDVCTTTHPQEVP